MLLDYRDACHMNVHALSNKLGEQDSFSMSSAMRHAGRRRARGARRIYASASRRPGPTPRARPPTPPRWSARPCAWPAYRRIRVSPLRFQGSPSGSHLPEPPR